MHILILKILCLNVNRKNRFGCWIKNLYFHSEHQIQCQNLQMRNYSAEIIRNHRLDQNLKSGIIVL